MLLTVGTKGGRKSVFLAIVHEQCILQENCRNIKEFTQNLLQKRSLDIFRYHA
jgi:hypothetical protein